MASSSYQYKRDPCTFHEVDAQDAGVHRRVTSNIQMRALLDTKVTRESIRIDWQLVRWYPA